MRKYALAMIVACLSLLHGCGDSENPSTKKIGPEGGSVTGPDDAKLVIPEGALAKELKFTIIRVSGTPSGFNPTSNVYEFGPTGTTFEVPVYVTLPYDPGKLLRQESDVRIWWSDSMAGNWSSLTGTVDTSSKTATGSTNHLSLGVSGEKDSPDLDLD